MQADTSAPRVAFGTLVENGYLRPGVTLYDAKRRWSAVVRSDGSLICDAASGSIHKVGATLQNAPSCNGWTFWHYEEGDGLKPIDTLRQTWLLATLP
jgi:modification methylase